MAPNGVGHSGHVMAKIAVADISVDNMDHIPHGRVPSYQKMGNEF